MAGRGLSRADLDDDVIDEHLRGTVAGGSTFPAARPVLPLASGSWRRQGVVVLRGMASRGTCGVSRPPEVRKPWRRT